MSAERGAVWLALAFAIGLAAVAGLAVRDNARRAALEVAVEETAVGDEAWFPLPRSLEAGVAVAGYGGASLRAAAGKPEKISDAEVVRVGRDDTGSFWLYRKRAAGAEGGGEGPLFLKVGDGAFLPVRAGG